jgi:hypothetical protein
MALDWRHYDGFDWASAQQSPMRADERAEIEILAANLMGVSRDDRLEGWGIASPPGRFAATVIQILLNIRHRYLDQASARQIAAVGVKIFKTNGDALREAKRVLPFHHEQVHKLPGLPNDLVQKSLGGGIHRNNRGVARYYFIQEWVPGDTLEALLRRKWSSAPADVDCVRSILEQLFLKIIIPLWSEGTIWWDIREANYCWDEALGKLQLIDIDSLAAYADEILKTPDVWERRDKGRKVALARLRQMTLRLLIAPRLGAKRKIQSQLVALWNSDLEPALNALGRDPQRKNEFKENALCAIQRALPHILAP